VNRVQKVLEDANIKLASVVSDMLGASARDMLAQLITGNADPQAMAQLARGRMRSKIDELEQALTGRIQEHHRLMLRLHLEHIEDGKRCGGGHRLEGVPPFHAGMADGIHRFHR